MLLVGNISSCSRLFVINELSVETRGRTLEEMARLFGIEHQLAEKNGIVVEKGGAIFGSSAVEDEFKQ